MSEAIKTQLENGEYLWTHDDGVQRWGIETGIPCPHCGKTNTSANEDISRFWGYGALYGTCEDCMCAYAPPEWAMMRYFEYLGSKNA